MSYSYYPKKLYATVFNTEAHPLRILATAAALAAGPIYFAPEVIYNQPSDQRTAVIGDAQYKNLDQSLTEVLALKQKSLDASAQSHLAHQTILANPDDKDAPLMARDMDNKKYELDRAISSSAKAFEQRLMLSEGISEKDAVRLMVKYKTAMPDAFSSYRDVAQIERQAAHLDECQIETFSDSPSGSYAAGTIESCIDSGASRQGFTAGFTRMMTGVASLGGLMFAFMMAGGVRKSVQIEEQNRRHAKLEKKSLQQPKQDAPKKLEITVFRKK